MKPIRKHLGEHLFRGLTDTARGGYKPFIGYNDTDVVASHFHYVCDGDGAAQTDISSLPLPTRLLLSDFTETVRETAVDDFGAIIGETCIQILWTPSQKATRFGPHKDFCWLTVPLYDSVWEPARPFHSAMAEWTEDGKALMHPFKVSKVRDRIYVVGFVQLPLDTIGPNGTLYADQLTKICYDGNSKANRRYTAQTKK